MPSSTQKIANAVALLAWALWLGGLVALGAISAPLVFGHVPMPYSADAMTLVFRRFDVLAMTCAAVVLAREMVALFFEMAPVSGGRGHGVAVRRIDAARMASVLVAGALAAIEGMWLSPAIEELHRSGAVRGAGELGERLETLHARAEAVSKVELLVLLAFIVLYAFAVPSQPRKADIPPT